MNGLTRMLKDVFYVSKKHRLSRRKYLFYSITVRVLSLIFIVYAVSTYETNHTSIAFFIIATVLLLYADYNLTAKRLRDVGVLFPYWISSLVFVLFAIYLAGFDNQMVRLLVITVSVIPYVLPTEMIKKESKY